MFSSMTMASSTTKPVAMVSAISVRLFNEKPHRYITAKVPTSDSGTAIDGITVADSFLRKTKVTITTRKVASISSCCTSRTAARMVWSAVGEHHHVQPAGMLAFTSGNSARMRSTTSMTLAPGWRWMFSNTAAVIGPGGRALVLGTVDDIGDVFQAQGRTVSVGQDQLGVFLRCLQLVVGIEHRHRVGPSKLPLGWLTLDTVISERTSASDSP